MFSKGEGTDGVELLADWDVTQSGFGGVYEQGDVLDLKAGVLARGAWPVQDLCGAAVWGNSKLTQTLTEVRVVLPKHQTDKQSQQERFDHSDINGNK